VSPTNNRIIEKDKGRNAEVDLPIKYKQLLRSAGSCWSATQQRRARIGCFFLKRDSYGEKNTVMYLTRRCCVSDQQLDLLKKLKEEMI